MALKVLFLCIHNSARSQMAEAFLNHLGAGKFEAESAGYEPGKLNPYVVRVMKEEGIDISGNKTKDVFDLYKAGRMYSYVISVCEENDSERCPIFPGNMTRLIWPFQNPAKFQGSEKEILDLVRELRDQIKIRILEFIRVVAPEETK